MKAGRKHQVPMTGSLKDVLEKLRAFNGKKGYVSFSPKRQDMLAYTS